MSGEFCANMGCFCNMNAMRDAYEAWQRTKEAEKAKNEKEGN